MAPFVAVLVLILAHLLAPRARSFKLGQSFIHIRKLSPFSSSRRNDNTGGDIDLRSFNRDLTRFRFREELAKYSLSRSLGLISSGKSGNIEVPPQFLFPYCSARPAIFGPTVNRYLIANPQTFFGDEHLLRSFNIDVRTVENDFNDNGGDLSVLAKFLPVIYVANVHSEFGWLGFQLNLFK